MTTRRQFLAASAAATLAAQAPSRPFRLGFTPFPTRLDTEGFLAAYTFLPLHSDIVALYLQDGIPWDQALLGRGITPYPTTFLEYIRFHRALMDSALPRMPRFLAVAPVSLAYTGIQPLWAETANMPLRYPWNTYDFDHPSVKAAVLNHMREMVDFFQPAYLGIGVESNIMLARIRTHWDAYLDLHRHLYTNLKTEYPRLTILFSIQYEHFLGKHAESAQVAASGDGAASLRQMMEFTDALAISSYPYLVKDLEAGPNYFDPAVELAGARVPLCIDQTGMTTRDLELGGNLVVGNEEKQELFLSRLMDRATASKFLFVINFVPLDFGDAHGTDDIAVAWGYTGLVTREGRPKRALALWDNTLARPHTP